MKRHPALEPFSRDHNVGLILARDLATGADGAMARFEEAWEAELRSHFDEEERLLGPLLNKEQSERLASEHSEIRALAQQGESSRLGELLDSHIRWEERELFPAIERSASIGQLASLAFETAKVEKSRHGSPLAPRRAELTAKRPVFTSPVIDLDYFSRLGERGGPVWGSESEQLDMTLLSWAEGEGIAEHVNDEVDILMVILSGAGEIGIGDEIFTVSPGQAILIPKGAKRKIRSIGGLAHLNIHPRRKRLNPMSSAPSRSERDTLRPRKEG